MCCNGQSSLNKNHPLLMPHVLQLTITPVLTPPNTTPRSKRYRPCFHPRIVNARIIIPTTWTVPPPLKLPSTHSSIHKSTYESQPKPLTPPTFIHPSVHPSPHQVINSFIYLSIHPLATHQSVHSFNRQVICSFVHSFIHPSLHPSVD